METATTEIRWFFSSEKERDVRNIFEALAAKARKEAVREDWYLSLSNNEVGFKLREGTAEIKQKAVDSERWIGGVLAGFVASYKKWSFPLAEHEQILQKLSHQWIPVQKDRQLKLYVPGENHKMQPWNKENWPEMGCQVEITLFPLQTDFISFNLEAFGQENDHTSMISNMIDIVKPLADSVQTRFDKKQSMDYPQWLEALQP